MGRGQSRAAREPPRCNAAGVSRRPRREPAGRTVSAAARDRSGRDGGGLPGRGHPAGKVRSLEGAPCLPRRRPGSQAAFRGRGAGGLGTRPSQHRHPVRDRRDRRGAALHGIRLLRGRDARRVHRPRPVARERGGQGRDRDRSGTGCGPRERDYSPRRQTLERSADRGRAGKASGLRRGQGGGGRSHRNRASARNGGVHESRARPGREARRTRRPLVTGRRALRDAHRSATLPGNEPGVSRTVDPPPRARDRRLASRRPAEWPRAGRAQAPV